MRAIHSALCTRVLLNLRRAAAAESTALPLTDLTQLSQLAFDRRAGLRTTDLGDLSLAELEPEEPRTKPGARAGL